MVKKDLVVWLLWRCDLTVSCEGEVVLLDIFLGWIGCLELERFGSFFGGSGGRGWGEVEV